MDQAEPDGRSAWSVAAVVVGVIVSMGAIGMWFNAHGDRSATAAGNRAAPSGAPLSGVPTGSSSPSVGVATPKMKEIAASFMLALRRYDAETVLSLIADDGVTAQLMRDNKMNGIMPSVPLNRRQLALALKAERIFGVQIEDPFGCRPNPDATTSTDAQVVCHFVMDDRLRQIVGLPPVETSFNIGIRNGRIDRLSFPWLNVSWDGGGFHPVEFKGFLRWLEALHPEAGGPERRGEVFRSWGQELVLILTSDSLDLLDGYLDEYERASVRYFDEYERASVHSVSVREVSRVVEGVRFSFKVPRSGWEVRQDLTQQVPDGLARC